MCTDFKRATKELPPLVAQKLYAAINYLEQAESLNDIAMFAAYRLHNLSGNLTGIYAMDLGKKLGYRLLITPDPPISKENESLDFNSKCKTVKHIIVLEVSNHYE